MVADVYSRRPKVGKTLMVVDRAFYLPEFHSISIYGTTNIYLIDTYILHNYIPSSPFIIFSEFRISSRVCLFPKYNQLVLIYFLNHLFIFHHIQKL